MSHAQYGGSPHEGWQDLISWDDELYDPFFQGETNYAGAHGGSFSADSQLSGSYTSEPTYVASKAPSIVDVPPSLEYTGVSASPSILDEQSFGYPYGTSPSFGKTAASPLAIPRDNQYYGSFGSSDNAFLSPLGNIIESPILDTRYERIPETFASPISSSGSITDAVFNPHVMGSSHSFSGLEMRASRAFSNWSALSEQPRIIGPIAEDEGGRSEDGSGRAEAVPIPIRQPLSQSFNSIFPPLMPPEGRIELHSHSRAIAIPDAARRPASYNNRTNNSGPPRRGPPIPSGSPLASRHPRAVALSRSASSSRRKSSTPSPTSSDSYAWVAYQPNPLTNRLAPTTTDGMSGRAPKGRKKALTPEQRRHAALMRIVRACSNCQRRKEKCDPGLPCKACLEHYKGDLVNHPCRDHTLSDLSGAFLSERLGWHPTARDLESFVPTGQFRILTDAKYTVPLNFGFGPAFPVSVHAVQLDEHPLVHEHIVYSWPPEPFSGPPHKHAVLPAVLCRDAQANLWQTLDSHLSLLVTHHFRAFPLYCSPLRILREVYIFSRSLAENTAHYRVLHEALKLLVLVHVGGDITLPPQSESRVLTQLISSTMDMSEDLAPTPCFIRSQFGAMMPGLAHSLMKKVLSSLEQFLLNKDCDEWPIALAVLITVLMTIESVHYHAAKLPYHHLYGASNASSSLSTEEDAAFNEPGVSELLDFYKACFSGCHARLRLDWEGETSPSQAAASTPGDRFIRGVQTVMKQANYDGYLVKKSKESRHDVDDMSYFFDRLVARLLKP